MTGPLSQPVTQGASMSMPIIARRPWRLIVIVLIVDVALAGAGAWLLAQGLAARATPVRSPAASTTR
jgi:hypothetical protein